jgi:acyl-CoA thioesterase FadM
MAHSRIGIATHHTRVESWECDFNHHWNARFYWRSFQLAAEGILTSTNHDNPGAAAVLTRNVRFHRELYVGAAVEVRSARVGTGEHEGAIVHLLFSEGTIAAAALDLLQQRGLDLPQVAAEEIDLAFPRRIVGQATIWDSNAPDAKVAETGAVRPTELDHTGALLFEEIVRRTAIGLHDQLSGLGFTSEFTNKTGVSRMAVEIRVTPTGKCPPGTPLLVKSRIASVRNKSFSSIHWLESHQGNPIAMIENSLVAVDMKTRRAVLVPDFMQRLKM